jgi:hypothetical protein
MTIAPGKPIAAPTAGAVAHQQAMPDASNAEEALKQLVGFAAYVRLRLFVEVAQHVWGTHDLNDAERLLRRTMHIGEQQLAFINLGQRRFGLSAAQLMGPFDGVFDSFLLRTQPKNWYEGLLRPIVTHGVSRDLIKLMARGLPASEAKIFQSILADDDPNDVIGAQLIRRAVAADPVLGAKLSLWARRVVGEAFSIGTDLMRKYPAFGELMIKATDDAGPGKLSLKSAQKAAFAELSAAHQERMESMGLTA